MKKLVCVLLSGLGMAVMGCSTADTSRTFDGANVDREAAAIEVIEMKAGTDVAKFGIASYHIQRIDGATSVALEAADGHVLGELAIYDPKGVMHMELSWENHEDAFELDLRHEKAPLGIVADEGVASIRLGRSGEPEGDEAAMKVYDAVKARWDVAAEIVRDLQIVNGHTEVAASDAFTAEGKPNGTTSAVATTPTLEGCGWCTAERCNFLGWNRWHAGIIIWGSCGSVYSACSTCVP